MLAKLFLNILNQNISYRKFPKELLGEFVNSTKTQCVVTVSDKDLVSLSNINLSWEKHSCLVVCPKEGNKNISPPGFKSKQKMSSQLISVVSGSMWNRVQGLFLNKTGFTEEIERGQSESLLVNRKTKYDDLVLFLRENGYSLVDVVYEKGDFALRGGIVDVFPHTTNNPIRCSFFDLCEIFHFKTSTQRSSKRVLDFSIPSLLSLKKVVVEELIDNTWLHFKYNDGVFGLVGSVDNFVDFPLKVFSYSDFVGLNKKHVSVSFLKLESDVGYCSDDKKDLFVPVWYENDRPADLAFKTSGLMVSDFEVGDYLIHRDCGVGRFLGVFDKGVDVNQDFVALEYGDGKVYVDVHNLHKISYYSSSSTIGVTLDFLSKRGVWENKKRRVKNKLCSFVEELYLLYNKKDVVRSKNYSFSKKCEQDFVGSFKYKDTQDQQTAWEEISLDLESDKCMDRLLCGDVGFGKTELAIRAAYKAVLGGGRVVVLAPTTILTKQLYASFDDRLSSYGVVVSFLSRVKSFKEKTLVETMWLEGKVDVLIGTHVVLNNDMFLKNSSLFIVDEEHRFGVKQKEKIRVLGNNVDYLSMSATPIPRTLGMALSGFKSISTLGSAPKSRKPITTEVAWYNEELIKRVIIQEYSRGGQSYFVNNNIKTLVLFFDVIKRLVPSIRVGIVHGKMKPVDVEKTMSLFVNKSVDILLCTSIIESGIDVQNANTVIVNNAHNFGLSQLYQIRGRVGRSSVQAFCYLLLPRNNDLNRSAFKRLKAVEVNTHLGAGYNISNMDLEIRGAGSVFGYKQSGGEAVGFELFSSLMNETNYNTYGLGIKHFYSVSFSSIFYGSIPETYIGNPLVRLSFYRRLNSIIVLDDIKNIADEAMDRFGKPPEPFTLLVKEFEIRLLSSSLGFLSIDIHRLFFTLELDHLFWEPLIDKLLRYLEESSKNQLYSYKHINKKGSYFIRFTYNGSKLSYGLIVEFLNNLKKIV